jgi:ABC-type branched-subunit amino acid transport system substrate-binding protein
VRTARALLAGLVSLAACTDDATPLSPCVPGEVRACPCPGGAPPGVQRCAEDGARFLACEGCASGVDAGLADGGDEPDCLPSRCAAQGPGFVCLPRLGCAQVEDALCRWRAGPRDAPSGVVASVLPLTGPLADVIPDLEPAVVLGVEAWNAAGGLGDRAVGLLSCDTRGDPALARQAVLHLEALGLSAAVGPATSVEVRAAGEGLQTADGPLLISPSATAPGLRDGLLSPSLVWSLSPAEAAQLPPLVALPTVRTASVGVVLALPGLGEALAPALAELQAAQGRAWPQARPGDVSPEAMADAAAARAGGPPTVIIVLGGDRIAAVAEALSSRWPRVALVLGDPARQPALLQAAARDRTLMARVEGTSPAPPEGPVARAFEARFAARYGHPPGAFAHHAQDALHLAVAAQLVAGPDAEGRVLAAALPNLARGGAAPLFLEQLADVRARLLAEGELALEGASGPLHLDPRTGQRQSAFIRWRIVPGDPGPRFAPAGRWDPAAQTWRGIP